MTPEGLEAGKRLIDQGIPVNVTLTFSPAQAILAAEIGATYVSPFIGRIDDVGADGMYALREICEIFEVQGYDTLVLAASSDGAIQTSVFHVTGRATVDGKMIRHAAQAMEEIRRDDERTTRPAHLPAATLSEPPDVVVTAGPDKLALSPGKPVEIAVKIERKKGFTGKVPLAVLGLPPGVTVDAPEIPENKAEGKITLKAEEEATPSESVIVVVGKSVIDDQQQASHAALPMTLVVGK